MEVKFCHNLTEDMKINIKKIIENSFDKNLRQSKESKASYTGNQLDKIYSNYIWNVMYIYLGDNEGYSFTGLGTSIFCVFKNYGIIIYPYKEKKNIKKISKENKEKKRLEENIKSLSNEKSDLNDKLSDSNAKIKEYEYILEKITIEKESLQKILTEKEIIDLQNEKIKLKNEVL